MCIFNSINLAAKNMIRVAKTAMHFLLSFHYYVGTVYANNHEIESYVSRLANKRKLWQNCKQKSKEIHQTVQQIFQHFRPNFIQSYCADNDFAVFYLSFFWSALCQDADRPFVERKAFDKQTPFIKIRLDWCTSAATGNNNF